MLPFQEQKNSVHNLVYKKLIVFFSKWLFCIQPSVHKKKMIKISWLPFTIIWILAIHNRITGLLFCVERETSEIMTKRGWGPLENQLTCWLCIPSLKLSLYHHDHYYYENLGTMILEPWKNWLQATMVTLSADKYYEHSHMTL